MDLHVAVVARRRVGGGRGGEAEGGGEQDGWEGEASSHGGLQTWGHGAGGRRIPQVDPPSGRGRGASPSS
ncbi:hypothetical protein GCM10020229_20670 [Kitasatospora albolonga]